MTRILGLLLGVSFQSELIIMTLLGLANSTLNWRPFELESRLTLIKELHFGDAYSNAGDYYEFWLKKILEFTVLVEFFLGLVLPFAYILNIYPVLTWMRPKVMLPWLLSQAILSTFTKVSSFVIVFLLKIKGVLPSTRFVEFLLVESINFGASIYNWYVFYDFYTFLKEYEQEKILKRSCTLEKQQVIDKIRSIANLPDREYDDNFSDSNCENSCIENNYLGLSEELLEELKVILMSNLNSSDSSNPFVSDTTTNTQDSYDNSLNFISTSIQTQESEFSPLIENKMLSSEDMEGSHQVNREDENQKHFISYIENSTLIEQSNINIEESSHLDFTRQKLSTMNNSINKYTDNNTHFSETFVEKDVNSNEFDRHPSYMNSTGSHSIHGTLNTEEKCIGGSPNSDEDSLNNSGNIAEVIDRSLKILSDMGNILELKTDIQNAEKKWSELQEKFENNLGLQKTIISDGILKNADGIKKTIVHEIYIQTDNFDTRQKSVDEKCVQSSKSESSIDIGVQKSDDLRGCEGNSHKECKKLKDSDNIPVLRSINLPNNIRLCSLERVPSLMQCETHSRRSDGQTEMDRTDFLEPTLRNGPSLDAKKIDLKLSKTDVTKRNAPILRPFRKIGWSRKIDSYRNGGLDQLRAYNRITLGEDRAEFMRQKEKCNTPSNFKTVLDELMNENLNVPQNLKTKSDSGQFPNKNIGILKTVFSKDFEMINLDTAVDKKLELRRKRKRRSKIDHSSNLNIREAIKNINWDADTSHFSSSDVAPKSLNSRSYSDYLNRNDFINRDEDTLAMIHYAYSNHDFNYSCYRQIYPLIAVTGTNTAEVSKSLQNPSQLFESSSLDPSSQDLSSISPSRLDDFWRGINPNGNTYIDRHNTDYSVIADDHVERNYPTLNIEINIVSNDDQNSTPRLGESPEELAELVAGLFQLTRNLDPNPQTCTVTVGDNVDSSSRHSESLTSQEKFNNHDFPDDFLSSSSGTHLSNSRSDASKKSDESTERFVQLFNELTNELCNQAQNNTDDEKLRKKIEKIKELPNFQNFLTLVVNQQIEANLSNSTQLEDSVESEKTNQENLNKNENNNISFLGPVEPIVTPEQLMEEHRKLLESDAIKQTIENWRTQSIESIISAPGLRYRRQRNNNDPIEQYSLMEEFSSNTES